MGTVDISFETLYTYLDLSQHIAGSRLTSNIKITLKITFTSEIFADITRALAVVLQHLKFCNFDLFSVECKFFCPNSADNTMENRAISLVESSRDNSLIACRTSSGTTHSKRGICTKHAIHTTHCTSNTAPHTVNLVYALNTLYTLYTLYKQYCTTHSTPGICTKHAIHTIQAI